MQISQKKESAVFKKLFALFKCEWFTWSVGSGPSCDKNLYESYENLENSSNVFLSGHKFLEVFYDFYGALGNCFLHQIVLFFFRYKGKSFVRNADFFKYFKGSTF